MVSINKVTPSRIIRPVKPSNKNQARMKREEPNQTDKKERLNDAEENGVKHIDERI